MVRKRCLFFMLISFVISLICSSCASAEELNYLSQPTLSDSTIVFSHYNDSLGRINAVKKARQLTDIEFTPIRVLKGLGKTYYPDKTYNGVMYSMVSEMGNYVGTNVSFHTFMTAVHNPKSKLYTEDVSQPPYHGRNCNSYYGSVCSQLVSYALGIFPGFSSRDFYESELMNPVDASEIDYIKIADVLWKNGHVALITDVVRDEDGKVTQIEISESVSTGCRRYTKNREEFKELVDSSFKKILRYTELYKNLNYTPIPEFVAVLDETPLSYQFNEDLCVDKGDKSNYLESDSIVVNIMHPYDYLEIYKGDELWNVVNTNQEDVTLHALPYGDYKARVFFNGRYSDFTYWKVVNVTISADHSTGRLYFHSENAKPLYVTFRDIAGLMTPIPTNTYGFHIFDDKDKKNGYVDINKLWIRVEYPYIRVYFSTEFGVIINTPLNWFEYIQ